MVLVGLNYTHQRGTGDKNFWATLVPLLAPHLGRITIISVRDETDRRELKQIGESDVEIRYVRPMSLPLTSSRSRPQTGRGGSYRRMIGLVERQLLVRRLVAELSDVLRDYPAHNVHLMDNFGPGNRLIGRTAKRLGACPSVTAIAYERRGQRLYHRFLQLSYGWPAMRVVAMSRQFRRRLAELGIHEDRLARIPWGVIPAEPSSSVDHSSLRSTLGLPTLRPIVLWAGFIQQAREADFVGAYRVAMKARVQGLDATFVFAFKPETFRLEYASLDRPDLGIHVMTTPVDRFAQVMQASDLLYSPIFHRDCIVAPPLTWIEAMAAGLPVLTTDVLGADELIEDGRTGYMARTDAELLEKLVLLCSEYSEMRTACRSKVAADYNLESIMPAYLRFWFGET